MRSDRPLLAAAACFQAGGAAPGAEDGRSARESVSVLRRQRHRAARPGGPEGARSLQNAEPMHSFVRTLFQKKRARRRIRGRTRSTVPGSGERDEWGGRAWSRRPSSGRLGQRVLGRAEATVDHTSVSSRPRLPATHFRDDIADSVHLGNIGYHFSISINIKTQDITPLKQLFLLAVMSRFFGFSQKLGQ